MKSDRYFEVYGVDKNDPKGYDGLDAPMTRWGSYDHPPLTPYDDVCLESCDYRVVGGVMAAVVFLAGAVGALLTRRFYGHN